MTSVTACCASSGTPSLILPPAKGRSWLRAWYACIGQVALGKFESGNLAQSFMRMGDKSELLAKSAREQSAALSESFEAPLKVLLLSSMYFFIFFAQQASCLHVRRAPAHVELVGRHHVRQPPAEAMPDQPVPPQPCRSLCGW
jgi:hypothetical protein